MDSLDRLVELQALGVFLAKKIATRIGEVANVPPRVLNSGASAITVPRCSQYQVAAI